MTKINTDNFNAWFSANQVLKSLNIEVLQNEVLGIIGPANSGKTTFLKCLNRLNDLEPNFRTVGNIFIDGSNICDKNLDINSLRKKVGMVFALPIPLPMTIFENVVYGIRRQGIKNKKKLEQIAEEALRAAYLWDEIKDRLDMPATKLSGGQQQRLCIARTLAVNPDVILFDEPCSGLDPISTAKVEEAIIQFKKKYTVVLVTNNTKQAARVSDRVAFFLMGEMIEVDKTEKIFTNPKDKRTGDYVSGRFG